MYYANLNSVLLRTEVPVSYTHLDVYKRQAYHSIFAGVKNLSDEIQVPALSGEELYNVFFQMRLDHPEIFWVTNFKYRYYKDSPNLIFIPEYLFEKNKIREHQKALTALSLIHI